MSLDTDDGEVNMEDDTITVRCVDAVTFTSKRRILLQSEVFKVSMEDPECKEVVLTRIDSGIFKLVLSYMTEHEIIPSLEIRVPIPSNDVKDFATEWDTGFITGLDDAHLLKVMLAANYLGIKGLTALTMATVATTLRGKNPDQIRERWQIRNDYTKEDEEEVRRKYARLLL